MPLHFLPQGLSRRHFFATLLGSLTLHPPRPACSLAAPPTSESWALLSDTHIAADPNSLARGISMANHLRQAVDEILQAHASKPFQGLLVNGDCAYLDGQPEDYQTFASLLQPASHAGIPIHLTLGNHDHRDHLLQATPPRLGFASLPSGGPPVLDKRVSVLRGSLCDWYLLDSLEFTNQTPGLLGEAQLTWLQQQLEAQPSRPALVVVHHNPQPPGLPKVTGLKDTSQLLSLLLRLPQVKALFFGHTHVAKTVQLGGLHLVNLPACAYRFHEAQPTGWTQATLDASGCTLTLFDTSRSHPLHGTSTRLDWR